MSELLAPILIMLATVFGEACYLQTTGKQKIDWRDIVFNLNSGHIMLWLFRCIEVLCYGLILNSVSLRLFDHTSALWLWLFTLLAWDFGFYVLHYLHHRWRLLWAVHVVHHQGEHYNLSLGVRNSWYSSLTAIPFLMPLALLGVPLNVYLAVSIIHYSVQFFNHNALTPKLGWLEKVFVTPSHHRVHHLNEKRYADTNYGGTFIFWDKLFGTFCPAPPQTKIAYGVKGSQLSCNPLRESNAPFLRLLGINAAARSSRRFSYAPLAIVSGALLLFALVLGYIQLYGYDIVNVTRTQGVLFILLAAGTVALGGVCDGQRWGVVAWCLVAVLFPLVFVIYFNWEAPFWFAVMMILTLHGIALAMGIGSRPTEDQP